MKYKTTFVGIVTVTLVVIIAAAWYVVPSIVKADSYRYKWEDSHGRREIPAVLEAIDANANADARAHKKLMKRLALILENQESTTEELISQIGIIFENQQLILDRLEDLVVHLDDTAEACRDKPDLVPWLPFPDFTLPKPPPTKNPELCWIYKDDLLVQVMNQGTAPAGPSTVLVVFSGDAGDIAIEGNTPLLNPDQSAIINIPSYPSTDDYSFKIIVDVNQEVDESNGANNIALGDCIIIN